MVLILILVFVFICGLTTRILHGYYTDTTRIRSTLAITRPMTKPVFRTNNNKWRPNLQRSLHEQWTRIELMVAQLPHENHINYDNSTKKQQQLIENINAIECEWLVDPIQRAELSVLVFGEDDDDLDDLIDRKS